jgi:hypothetical protein
MPLTFQLTIFQPVAITLFIKSHKTWTEQAENEQKKKFICKVEQNIENTVKVSSNEISFYVRKCTKIKRRKPKFHCRQK